MVTTLYLQLGGRPAMEAAVDVLAERLRRDPQFASEGRSALPCPRERLVDFLTYILAGSPNYEGGSIWESHAARSGSAACYRRFVDHLLAALIGPDGSVALALEIRAIMERIGDEMFHRSEEVEA